MTEIRLKDDLIDALNKYNDIFIPGSKKRLKLVNEID